MTLKCCRSRQAGLIFDRNGIPLVQNITLYRLQVIPSKIADMSALLQALSPIVDLTADDIASFRDDMHHNSRYKEVTLKSDLTDVEVARFAVNEFRFPGVTVESYQQRSYPYGAELAHVVGYVSKINDNDLQRLAKTAKQKTTRPIAISVNRGLKAITRKSCMAPPVIRKSR